MRFAACKPTRAANWAARYRSRALVVAASGCHPCGTSLPVVACSHATGAGRLVAIQAQHAQRHYALRCQQPHRLGWQWRVLAADGLLWCGRHSIAAIPALIAAWLAETGSFTRGPAPMAALATGCRRLGGTVPLTIVCGVYVLRLFTVRCPAAADRSAAVSAAVVRLIQAIAMLWMSQAMNATTIAHPRA